MNRAEAEKRCEQYFRSCDKRGRHYSLAGLMVALGADQETWDRWVKQRNLKVVLGLAMARIKDDLEQREDKMALSLIGRPPYGGPDGETGGVLRVVFGDGGDVKEYGG